MSAARACAFCGGADLEQTHDGLYHPFKPDHGPFAFHRCRACGSGLTVDPPSAERLDALYTSFRDGLPALHRDLMAGDPQRDLYLRCARRLLRRAARTGAWVDVGAGGGELSEILGGLAPDSAGAAVDRHERPERLTACANVRWIRADLNDDGFAARAGLEDSADMVISTAVWEHVVRPDAYALELVRMLRPGGVLYLLCPNYGSLARRGLGRRWPYFTPGEHLNMPTARGARACLGRQWAAVHPNAPEPVIHSGPLALPYSLRYVLRRFGFDRLGKLVPPRLGLPLPAGALETVLVAPQSW